MKDNQDKPDMKRYDYLGLVKQLIKSEEDPAYIIGAMEAHGERLKKEDLKEAYNEQLRSNVKSGSGLELAIKAHSKKYNASREKTTLGEFCDIYSVSDYIRSSLAKYFGETIGDIEKEFEALTERANSKSNFTKKQKEEAEKKLEIYGPIMAKIKLVEDKRFAQLKINALERTEKNMSEDEKRDLEGKVAA